VKTVPGIGQIACAHEQKGVNRRTERGRFGSEVGNA